MQTTNTIATLAQRAMLVALNISVFEGRRTDAKINKEVAEKHGTSSKVGNYRKSILPNAPSLDKVKTVAGEIRRKFYYFTLPWAQNGSRILLASGYEEFAKEYSALKMQYESAVAEFILDYPALKDKAKEDLNGLYDEADYPSEADLPGLFGCKLSVLPLPVAGDFRVEIADSAVEAIRSSIENETRAAIADAQADVWSRLRAPLDAMLAKMQEPDAIFRNTLWGNVKDVVEILPSLNIGGDSRLDAVASAIREQVLSVEPDLVRTNKHAREQTAERVAQIIDMLPKEFMGEAA